MSLVDGSIVSLFSISITFHYFIRQCKVRLDFHRRRRFDRWELIEIARLEAHNGVIALSLVLVIIILLQLWSTGCAILAHVEALSIVKTRDGRFTLRRRLLL